MVFLAKLALYFHSGISITTTSCFKMYSPSKVWKKSIDNASFFAFLITLDLIWTKFHPQIVFAHLAFFVIFNEKCLEIQLILITCVSLQSFWKKIGKTSKNCYFWPQIDQKRGLHGPCTQNEKHFFRNN